VSQTTKLRAFVEHGFRKALSYKLNFTAHYVSTFVSVLFFYFLDRLFTRSGVDVVGGGSYFAFLLIGGAFSRYLDLTMRSFAENLREEMLQGTLEPLLVTATPTVLALLGPSAWMLVEGTVLAFVQLLLGTLLGADLSGAHWPAAALVYLFSLSSLLSYGILSAAFTLVFKRSDPLNWVVGATAYLFSGVYFPISILPPALRAISYLLPFTYAIDGLRGALMRGEGPAALKGNLLALLVFTLVLLPLSVWALRRAIHRVKVTGELTHY
jgi:ABC-2 type transport system permease protein